MARKTNDASKLLELWEEPVRTMKTADAPNGGMEQNKKSKPKEKKIMIGSRSHIPQSIRSNAGRKLRGVKAFVPACGWGVLSLNVAQDHITKLENLALYRGTPKQVSLYDLLESALSRYEELNNIDLLSPPAKTDIF